MSAAGWIQLVAFIALLRDQHAAARQLHVQGVPGRQGPG